MTDAQKIDPEVRKLRERIAQLEDAILNISFVHPNGSIRISWMEHVDLGQKAPIVYAVHGVPEIPKPKKTQEVDL